MFTGAHHKRGVRGGHDAGSSWILRRVFEEHGCHCANSVHAVGFRAHFPAHRDEPWQTLWHLRRQSAPQLRDSDRFVRLSVQRGVGVLGRSSMPHVPEILRVQNVLEALPRRHRRRGAVLWLRQVSLGKQRRRGRGVLSKQVPLRRPRRPLHGRSGDCGRMGGGGV